MLSVNYDYPPVKSGDDPIVVAIENQRRRFMHELQPGSRLVEYIPWLRYIPSR